MNYPKRIKQHLWDLFHFALEVNIVTKVVRCARCPAGGSFLEDSSKGDIDRFLENA